MEKFNPQVDAYISKAEDFAKPILEHWRKLIHEACPETTEAVKWSYPHFDYKGSSMFVIAAYKKHCSFTFMKAELMGDPRLKESKTVKAADRFLGKITSVAELPSDKEFMAFLKEAIELNEKGVKVPAKKPDKPKVIETPDYLIDLLNQYPKVKEIFDSRSDSFRKEYISWIVDAKTDATRQKRIDEAMKWISEGKSRFWKYAK